MSALWASVVLQGGDDGSITIHRDGSIAALHLGNATIQGSPDQLAALLDLTRSTLAAARASFDGKTGARVHFRLAAFTDAEVTEAFKVGPAEDRALEPCETGGD